MDQKTTRKKEQPPNLTPDALPAYLRPARAISIVVGPRRPDQRDRSTHTWEERLAKAYGMVR